MSEKIANRLKPSKLSRILAALLAAGTLSATENYTSIPLDQFELPDDLEITEWAASPLFFNPTNIDIDHKGRVWVAEGVNYRFFKNSLEGVGHAPGDRIVILEDSDGDGTAETSKIFWQDTSLVAPLGISVIDNKIIVSQPPHLIVITDVNRNDVFDNSDTKEILLTGFGGLDHDHSLHSVTVGPNGQYYFNTGNSGDMNVKSKDLNIYTSKAYGDNIKATKTSSDGHKYIGGVAMRVNPDGSDLNVIGHNSRNSYEQAITSFGDVFQNDNDDPPACRTTWLMEYGNLGYKSEDGLRGWRAERRPGQSTAVSEWRQEDPGVIPAGDVYGSGAPTGIVFMESEALGEQYKGLLLSCEPTRNVIFGYNPKPKGAGFSLDRFDFVSTNNSNQFYGGDYTRTINDELKFKFRPSDVAIAPDGSIFIADWYDARVGGHATFDKKTEGYIYRIAPKGKSLKMPKIDYGTLDGLIEAFKNPATNVRGAAFYGLREKGTTAIPAVAKLLKHKNEYIQARALFLLAQLGDEGIAIVEKRLSHKDAQMRIAAFRALRFVESNLLKHAFTLSKDDSQAVRREVALSLRDIPFDQTKKIVSRLFEGYNGQDRWYLEAIGTACSLQEEKAYKYLKNKYGQKPSSWSSEFADIAWRLHPDSSIKDLKAYVDNPQNDEQKRFHMLTAIAYIETQEAGDAMLETALNAESAKINTQARWFVENRSRSHWRKYGLAEKLGAAKAEVYDALVPPFPKTEKEISLENVLSAKGDIRSGTRQAARCLMCHKIGDQGVDFGPDLTTFGRGNPREVLALAIINPSRDIAHGYDAVRIKTKNNKTVEGFIVSEGDSVQVNVFGGNQITIDASEIASRERLEESVMPSAASLELSFEQVADIVAYLQSI